MPIWIIEYFGSRELDRAFLLIALMTAPAWIAMILFPFSSSVRAVAQPWVLPPLLSTVLVILFWKSLNESLLPGGIDSVTYSAARELARHPVAFLVVFCNLQLLNLTVGTLMYQKANRAGFAARIELTLCWFFGALALIPFALRLVVKKKVGA